jgi:hypothetical protein
VAAPALVVLALGVSPAVTGQSQACAAGVDHAALVIDTGARTTRYCVELDAPTISGLHLIELAAGAYGLDYQLGFAGKAVCRLEGVGVDGGDCFDAFPDFWAYWRGDGSGGWTWSTIGAADTTVADGDVEGWSWGSGTDAASHQRPPRTPAASVCGDPPPRAGGGGPPHDGSGGADGGHNGSSATGAGGDDQPQTNVGPAVSGADEPRAGAEAGGREAGGGSGGETGDAEIAGSAARSHAGADTPGAATPTPASTAPPSPSAVSSRVEAMPLTSNSSRAAPPIAALAFAGAAIALLLLAGWLCLRRRAGSA